MDFVFALARAAAASPLAWAAGAVLTMAALYKAGPDAWRFVKAAARAPYTIEELAKAPARLDRLEAQFSNNGGSTLRDAVDRIESRLDAHLDAHAKAPA